MKNTRTHSSRRPRSRVACLVVWIASLAVSACSSKLDPASLVTAMRVVGVSYAVEGDLTRATPVPGEQVHVEFDVIRRGPAEGTPVNYIFAACVASANTIGVPRCRIVPNQDCGPLVGSDKFYPCPDFVGTPTPGSGTSPDNISFSLTMPSGEHFGESSRVLIAGAVCEGGELASLIDLANVLTGNAQSVTTDGCAVDAPESAVGALVAAQLDVKVAGSAVLENRSPEIAASGIRLQLIKDGPSVLWNDVAAPDAPATGCQGSGIVEPFTGTADQPVTTVVVELSVTPESVEQFTVPGGEGEPATNVTEVMQISWLNDGPPSNGSENGEKPGEFASPYGFIEAPGVVPNGVAYTTSTEWKFPTPADPTGTLVRFNFVVRDRRGGTTWTERAMCVVPPTP